jgi:hypothetical protein
MIEWNANAARLTAYQKAEIEAGRNPGDDGSGISFVAMDDTIYLIHPSDVNPIGVCRIVDASDEIEIALPTDDDELLEDDERQGDDEDDEG